VDKGFPREPERRTLLFIPPPLVGVARHAAGEPEWVPKN